MKRHWTLDDLIDHWTLTAAEQTLLADRRGDHNRLGVALLLKFFQLEARFPRGKHELPAAVITYVAKQLALLPAVYLHYDWQSRTIKSHRAEIRAFLGVREGTVADAEAMVQWLHETILPHDHHSERLKEAVYAHYRALKIEPPTPRRVERLIASARHTYEQRFCAAIHARLSPESCTRLDALLTTADPTDTEVPVTPGDEKLAEHGSSPFYELKRDPGRISLESMLSEIAKLQRLRELGLPSDLFKAVPHGVLRHYRQRVAGEPPREVRRHPDAIRYTLLAAFCWLRRQEITDALVDLLLGIVKKIGVRAEKHVDRLLLAELKRVRGKGHLLYSVAEAALADPDGTVRTVIYPVAGGEQTLRNVVAERQAVQSYDTQVQTTMRQSYGHHYRRMVPELLQALVFHSNNERHRPVIRALDLLTRYAASERRNYPDTETVPIEGVVPLAWREFVVQQTRTGKRHINRITYEICVLQTLRDRVRCKEIWVEGAARFRNPDEDLPSDFSTHRSTYYEALRQPLDVEAFITQVQQAQKCALETLDRGLPDNDDVKMRANGKIVLSPLEPQSDPPNVGHLKTEVAQLWPMTSLLDMLKETDLRVNFTEQFKSSASRETLDRATIRKRLLLCLYGLGTNTGLKRIGVGEHGETYKDLLYIRRRYLLIDHVRAAIREVVNAIFQVRRNTIWGEGTTACASDSKKFGAWDQNLLTEWHIRYRGPGVMVYWHVEKKSACIYSQLKSCTSSEVAAMIEGVLRHCTDMVVEKQYVDSHGQSEVAFAFCHLLGFQLLPRLKAISQQKLYRPESGNPEAYPHLQSVLTRPIQWDLIRQQYDEMIKYATALRLGTAEAEAILRRFTRTGIQHPTYKALAELGKVVKTIFLCNYLHTHALRREIHEGLNVIENWNSANSFIFYGKGGEIATNQRADQELAILSLHLLQISMVYINTLMIQRVLDRPFWHNRLNPDDLRALSPLIYAHVNPYGLFNLEMDKRLLLDDGATA